MAFNLNQWIGNGLSLISIFFAFMVLKKSHRGTLRPFDDILLVISLLCLIAGYIFIFYASILAKKSNKSQSIINLISGGIGIPLLAYSIYIGDGWVQVVSMLLIIIPIIGVNIDIYTK